MKQDAGRPSLVATRANSPPLIDGKLDDQVWTLTTPSAGLTQVEPREGESPTQRTEIRALFDADTLYLAVRCEDLEPTKIIGTQMKRDADLDTDDRVQIVLDTFVDHRNGFLFAMNPVGAKLDALVSSNGGEINEAWDGIWEERASIDPTGWSIELAIPFKTLSFDSRVTTWGFNVQRVIKRRLEVDRWASPQRNHSVFQVSEAGTVSGLKDIRQGLGLDVVPFFTTHWDDDGTRRVLTGEPGFDAYYHITPNLGAALTVNTDFAETEVDERRINLTRFPLFFPEKRDFFLQDAGIFKFADLEQDLIPFFSRRIGLDSTGAEVPIAVGTKLTGRVGDFNVGILDTQTKKTSGVDAANLLVTRVSKNVGAQSSVGAILTSGDPDGRGTNSLFGLDANFGTTQFQGDRNLRASLWGLESFKDSDTDNAAAFGTSLSYPNDIWAWSVAWKEIQDDFDPALGFVPRTGVREYSAGIQYEPIVNRDVRRLEFGFDPAVVTNLDDRVESAEARTRLLGVVWDSGDEVRVEAIPQYERLDQAFDIANNVTVPAGEYDWLRWRLEVESALKRPVNGALGFEVGEFFDGTRTDWEASMGWRPSRHFTGELAYTESLVDLPDGSFVVSLATLRANAAFSPELIWSNFWQFDSESDTLGWNSRVQWILKPTEECALVYSNTMERDQGSFKTESQTAVIKFQYTMRL